jgi:flagellum-specific peptidoglycan hydrolase FlgJ
LVREGYATDPAYADKLIRILREHGWGNYHRSGIPCYWCWWRRSFSNK